MSDLPPPPAAFPDGPPPPPPPPPTTWPPAPPPPSTTWPPVSTPPPGSPPPPPGIPVGVAGPYGGGPHGGGPSVGPPGPPGAGGTPPGPRRRIAPFFLVPAAVALVALAMGAAWALTRDEPDPSSTTALTVAPDDPDESTTTTVPERPEDEDLESVVAELSAFVEAERGLEFREPVDVELAADAEFERRLLDDFEAEDEADLLETERIFRALGFLDADDDLVEQLRGVLSGGVVGFYDPETDELVVRGGEPTPYARSTIVHELTHALDDQHFELDRPELDEADDETGFAFTSLVEGSAVTVEEAYQDTLSDEEQRRYDEEEAAIGSGTDFSQFPPILLDLIGAPYEFGPVLVDAITTHGGDEALDQAFVDPPVSSEQVLDPSRYLTGDEPVRVPEPPAEGESFDQGTFGELLLFELLADGGVDTGTARDAAIGWGGDQYVAWREGGRTCLRVSFVGDTDTDTGEIAEALAEWAEAHPDAEVTTGDDGRPTLTSCG